MFAAEDIPSPHPIPLEAFGAAISRAFGANYSAPWFAPEVQKIFKLYYEDTYTHGRTKILEEVFTVLSPSRLLLHITSATLYQITRSFP